MLSLMKTLPTVFAVGENYQIMAPFTEDTVFWVRVGEECFYDHACGVLRSAVRIHRVTVPGEILNAARRYTVCYRRVIERRPYFPLLEDTVELTYDFRPLPDTDIRIYHVADAHGMVDAPVAAAKKFSAVYGGIDLLVLNGDVIDHSGSVENFDAIYRISEGIAAGEIPVVFSRGNHDTRGLCAERFCEYIPLSPTGDSYFSVRQGPLWAVVIDCGEDKPDGNAEYGGTVCFADFREREEAFLNALTEHSETEYAAPGVRYRLVFSHMPFTRKNQPPFDIEEARYTAWAELLRTYVRPQLFLAGHTHRLAFDPIAGDADAFGQPSPIAVLSAPDRKNARWSGGGCILKETEILVVYNSAEEILEERQVPLYDEMKKES